MDIRQFRSKLSEAFEALGFERKRPKGTKLTGWALPGHQVERIFWEHAMRRPWGFRLSGSLAIEVPRFREWLSGAFPPDEHGLLTNGVIGRHIANYPDMLFATEQGHPPYGTWVAQIREQLAAIPDTIEGLMEAERTRAPGLMLLWDEHYAPASWAYFRAWASGQEPAMPPPSTTPTGQIIYTAANDPA